MRMLVSCKYHEDSQSVELLYTDGTLIDIDCMAVEDEVARNMYERSELDYLLNHDPAGYADLILNGNVEAYLRNVTTIGHWTRENNINMGGAVQMCSTTHVPLCVEK